MSEELKEKLRKELRVFQDYTASWGYPMNSEVHRTGLDKAEAKLLELFESYAKEIIGEDEECGTLCEDLIGECHHITNNQLRSRQRSRLESQNKEIK